MPDRTMLKALALGGLACALAACGDDVEDRYDIDVVDARTEQMEARLDPYAVPQMIAPRDSFRVIYTAPPDLATRSADSAARDTMPRDTARVPAP